MVEISKSPRGGGYTVRLSGREIGIVVETIYRRGLHMYGAYSAAHGEWRWHLGPRRTLEETVELVRHHASGEEIEHAYKVVREVPERKL